MASVSSILKNSARFSIPTAVSAFLSLALVPIISRVYPANDYGVINLFYTLGNFFMTFGLLGLDNALIRYYQEPLSGLDHKRAFSLSLFLGIFVILAIGLIAIAFFPVESSQFVFGEENASGLFLLVTYSLSLVVFRLLSIVARQEFDFIGYNVQQIVLIVSNKALFVLAVLISTNYFPSIVLMTAMTAASALLFLFAIARNYITIDFRNIPFGSMRVFFSFAILTMPAALLMWLNSSVAKLALAGFGRYEEVGVFALAFTIANAFSVIPSAFSIYWSPFVYKNYKTENALIKRMQGLLTGLSVFLVVLFVFSQDLIYLLLGGTYSASQQYFMLVMLFPIQTLLVETIGYGIYLADKPHLRLGLAAVSALANVILCVMLIPSYGGLGAATAMAASASIMVAGSYVLGQKYYQSVQDPKKTIIAYMGILILCIGNCWGFSNVWIRASLVLVGLAIFCQMSGREAFALVQSLVSKIRK